MNRLPILAAACAALAGGCAMSMEGDLQEIEVTQPDVQIPGVPPTGREIEDNLSLPIAQQVRERLGLPASAYREVKVHAVRVTATGGVSDLSFIRSLRFTMNGIEGAVGAGSAPLEIARYDRVEQEPAGPTLSMPSRPPVDVLAQWLSPVTLIGLEAAGDLPDAPWTAEIVVVLSARLKY